MMIRALRGAVGLAVLFLTLIRPAAAQTTTTTTTTPHTTTTNPAGCCGPATCGMTIKVGADNTGKTLFLQASDPILSAPCPGSNGITVINKGRNARNQSF